MGRCNELSEQIEKRHIRFLQGSLCSKAQAVYEVMERYKKLSTKVAGTLCEIMLSQALEPYIPPPYEVGYGEIISSDGETSGECDLIVYRKPVLL